MAFENTVTINECFLNAIIKTHKQLVDCGDLRVSKFKQNRHKKYM